MENGELIRYYTETGYHYGHFDEFIKRTIGKGKKKEEAPPTYALVTPIGPSKKNRIKVAVSNISKAEKV
jgi:hypothetical protein